MSGTDPALADGLATVLRSHPFPAGDTDGALFKSLSEGGWLEFFELGLSGQEGISLAESLLAGEALGTFAVPPGVMSAAGYVVPLLKRLGSDAPLCSRISDLLAAGERIAVALPSGRQTVSASAATGMVRLNGSVDRVAGVDCERALVPVQIDGGPAFALIDTGGRGVSVRCHESVVVGHMCGELQFDDTPIPASDIRTDTIGAATQHAATVFSLLLDVHAVGVAAECLRRSVAYTATRHQFGQPVGAFQAVQHMAAEILIRVETSRSAVWSAASALASGSPEAPELIAASRLHCMLSAQTAAELAIQMHGGAGFTWEYGLHHFYRAAMFARHYLTHEHGVRASLAASIRRSTRLQAEIGAAA